MGYYVTVNEMDLKAKTAAPEGFVRESRWGEPGVEVGYADREDFWVDWIWPDDGVLDLDEWHFKYHWDFEKDLAKLQKLGVRGYISLTGEEGEHFRFELSDEGIEEFAGEIQWKPVISTDQVSAD